METAVTTGVPVTGDAADGPPGLVEGAADDEGPPLRRTGLAASTSPLEGLADEGRTGVEPDRAVSVCAAHRGRGCA